MVYFLRLQYQLAVRLADDLAGEENQLYSLFSKEDMRKMLLKFKESSVAMLEMDNRKDAWGYKKSVNTTWKWGILCNKMETQKRSKTCLYRAWKCPPFARNEHKTFPFSEWSWLPYLGVTWSNMKLVQTWSTGSIRRLLPPIVYLILIKGWVSGY